VRDIFIGFEPFVDFID